MSKCLIVGPHMDILSRPIKRIQYISKLNSKLKENNEGTMVWFWLVVNTKLRDSLLRHLIIDLNGLVNSIQMLVLVSLNSIMQARKTFHLRMKFSPKKLFVSPYINSTSVFSNDTCQQIPLQFHF